MNRKNLKTFTIPGLLFVLAAVGAVAPPPGVGLLAPLSASANVSAAMADDSSSIGTVTTIDFPGATGTLALDINAEGAIVGRYAMAGRSHGFLRTVEGEFVTIDVPGASLTVAASINDWGDIVGMYAVPTAPSQRHGFLLKDGEFTSFDPPGSTFTNALGINNRRDIVGRYCTLATCGVPGNGNYRGFLLREGEYTTLHVPNARETDAFKINNAGQIAGGFVSPGGEEDPFVWWKDEFNTLALPNGKPVTLDNGGINERGDLVGTYCANATPCLIAPNVVFHGFVIRKGEFTTIDLPGANATAAIGINARGDIVGAYITGGQTHGFLLSR